MIKPEKQVPDKLFKELYSEEEAAGMLGISVPRLRSLLDKHVFNDGTTRPPQLHLRSSDLVLLRFWHRSEPRPKVLRMPKKVSP